MAKPRLRWNYSRTYEFMKFGLILDPEVWDKTLAHIKKQPREYPNTAGATVFYEVDNGYMALVGMREDPELAGIQIAALLAHEAQHIVQFIEDKIGEEKFSHEAECYLLQHIFQDLLQDYIEQKGYE